MNAPNIVPVKSHTQLGTCDLGAAFFVFLGVCFFLAKSRVMGSVAVSW